MSKPAFNDFSTSFKPEVLGVELTGQTITTGKTTDWFGTDRYSAIIVYLDVTVTAGTLDVKLQTLMPTADQAIQIAAMTQIVATGKSGMGFVSSGNTVFTDAALAAGTFKTMPMGQRCSIALVVSGGANITINAFDVILIR